MKRLIRKAFGQLLYHGTTLENLQSITDSGMIMPQETDGAGLDVQNKQSAKDRAFNRLYDEGLRPDTEEYDLKYESYFEEEYEKELKKINGYTFFTDSMVLAKDYSNSSPIVVLEVSLPEDSLLPDDNDCDDCVEWAESLQRIGQVKVPGTITDDYIVGVHIFKDRDDEGQFFPKLEWVNQYVRDEELQKASKRK